MVSDISHQLKTPVAALDTCFSVLMQNDLSATEQEEGGFVSVVGVLWMDWRHYCSRFLKYPRWKLD